MKRLTLIIAVFLTVLTLAGCGLLPDDVVDEATQELCADDPNNELCDLDNLAQLEEQVVVQLVKDAITKINGIGCLDIVFVGNKSLMETCENSPEDLVPNGVTSLEVLSFEEIDGQYTIYGKTNMDGVELEIKISIVEIDGKSFINDWATNTTIVASGEISDREIDIFFDLFFDAYTDTSITSTEFCDTYYDGDQEACRIGRDSTINDYSSITGQGSLSKKGYDYYKNASALSVNGETSEIEVGLTLSKNSIGSIVITMISIPSLALDVIDVAEEKLPLMFADLFNTSISDNQLIEMYIIENMPDRMMVKDEFESIEFLSIALNEDETVSTKVRVKFKAGADLSKKVNIAFEEDDDGELVMTYRFIDPDQMSPDIDIPYIEAYFRDYFDPEITDDEFYEMYEGPRGHAGNKKDKKRISSGSVIVNVYESASQYLVEVTGETETERILWRLDVSVNRWDSSIALDFNDNIDNDCDGYCDSNVTSPEEHKMLFNWFIDDYFDIEISDESFNLMYFNNMMEQDFFDIRKEVQDMKNRYQIIDQVGPTGGAVFLYLLDIDEDMNPNGEVVPVRIMKRIDQSTPLLFIIDDDDDGDGVPTDEEVMTKLSNFKEMANRHSIAYTVMCATSTPSDRVDACAQMVSSKIATGYQLTSFMRLQHRPDLLVAEWENAVGEMVTDYYFFFPYYNDMGEVIFELIPYTLTEYDMLEIKLEVYVESLNNPLDKIADSCMYVDESSQDECVELKTYLLQSQHQIMDYYVYYDEDLQGYVVVMNVYTSDMEYIGSAEYDVVALETNPLHQSRGTRAVNPMFESNN